MSWIQENKFVAGLLGVTLVGAGALGYLLTSAKASYEESNNAFTEQTTELSRLQNLPGYPNQENYLKLEEQRQKHQALVEDLQRQLATAQISLEPITPFQFQDKLKAAVTDFKQKASNKLQLPDNFYFGFDVYSATPPAPEAAPLLFRQLRAIQLIFDQLLKNEVTAVTKFDRPTLPEEGLGGSRSTTAAAPQNTPAKPAAPKDPVTPVEKQQVDLEFLSDQRVAQDVLNALATSRTQLFIPRFVAIENQVKVGPPKTPAVDPSAPAPVEDPAAAGAAPAPGTAAAAAAPKTPIIVGDEKITVTMRVEIVYVPEPAAPVATISRTAR